jgi:AraC family transcriptional regulator of adaptative response / DNA-3-methyladenine glycosylase II
MLAKLRAQAIPGIECVAADAYRRTMWVNEVAGHFEVTLNEERRALRVRVTIDEPRSLFQITERIRAMFDLDADWPTIERVLKSDPGLAPLVRACPGLRVAGCWSGFELAVNMILSGHAARVASLTGELVGTFGKRVDFASGLTHLFPRPEVLASVDLERAGLSKMQSLAVRTLACAVHEGRIRFEKLADPDAALRHLASIPGFTVQGVQNVAMRALREPDAFPLQHHEVGRALGLEAPMEIERRMGAWRPWRAYAAAYLAATPAPAEPQASLRNSRRKSSTSASVVI